MELVVNENVYFDLDEANKLVSDRLLSISDEYKFWNSLSDNDKAVLIITGTEIFEKLHFIGSKLDNNQKLQFPRLYKGDTVNISNNLKFGILLNLINKYKSQSSNESRLLKNGVKKYSVEGASIEFQSDTNMIDRVLNNGVYKSVFDEYFINYVW